MDKKLDLSKKGINALKEALMRAISTYRDFVIMDGELYRTNSENLIRDVLNIALKLNLVNANTIKKNYETIDLIDEEKKFVVQVSTASNTTQQKKKIKKTLTGFQNNALLQQNEKLLIVFLLNLETNFEYKKQKPNQTVEYMFGLTDNYRLSMKYTDLNKLYTDITSNNQPEEIRKILETIQQYTGELVHPIKLNPKMYSSNEKGSGHGTMESFLKYLGVENDSHSKTTVINDVITLTNELSSLSNTSRQVITEIILRRDLSNKSYVRFNYEYLKSISPSPDLLDTNLQVLVSKKFINSDVEYDNGSVFYRLRSPNISEDLFIPMVKFLNNDSKLKKIIEELDFSVLN